MPPVSPARISLPDRYKVVRHIANGGMAGVWEAHDELLDRSVAVKVLAQHLSEDERARKRFEREARAAAGLSSHPNVVTIYDVAEHDGRAFMVMELLRGGSVADVLRREERIDHHRALRWLREAASALDAAHEAGIVHRDVKPANLLLDEHDRLAIGDFGIARLAWEEQVTQTGQVLGTAAYLAPEQAMGEPAIAASDRYALSVVAFELLTGEKPFNAEHFAAQARAHVEDDPPRASELNRDLTEKVDAVIDRGMAKDPDDRWETAAEFVERLDESLAPPPPRRPTNGAPRTRSTRLMTGREGTAAPPPPTSPPRSAAAAGAASPSAAARRAARRARRARGGRDRRLRPPEWRRRRRAVSLRLEHADPAGREDEGPPEGEGDGHGDRHRHRDRRGDQDGRAGRDEDAVPGDGRLGAGGQRPAPAPAP